MQKPAKYNHLIHAGRAPGRVVIHSEQIAERVNQLAAEIAADAGSAELTIVAVMTGALMLTADLVRALPGMMRIHLIDITSYPGTATTAGELTINSEIDSDSFTGCNVLIVDDVLDTGRTLAELAEKICSCGARSVKSCVLVSKPSKTRQSGGLAMADYVGFEIPDEFVVGYGMDFDDKYRNLPDICVLEQLDTADKE